MPEAQDSIIVTVMASWLTGCDSVARDAQRARRSRLHAVQGLRGGNNGHAAVLVGLSHGALRFHVHVLLAGQLISAGAQEHQTQCPPYADCPGFMLLWLLWFWCPHC